MSPSLPRHTHTGEAHSTTHGDASISHNVRSRGPKDQEELQGPRSILTQRAIGAATAIKQERGFHSGSNALNIPVIK